jgi:nitroreductase
METFKAIGKRCSLKTRLSGRAMVSEKINIVLDAARLAPSARNMQPRRFIVVQGTQAVKALVEAAFFGSSTVIKQAPVIIVACSRPEDDVVIDGKEYYLFDVALAMENMLLAATDLGLVTHPMISFDEVEVRRALRIPNDVRVVIVTPLAYPDADSYDEAARERLNQRSRKILQEIVYFGRWGE